MEPTNVTSKKKFILGFVIGTLLGLTTVFLGRQAFAGASPSQAEKNRTRIEELFMWRVSDSLGFDTNQEAEFKKVMKKIREDRQNTSKQIEITLQQLESAKGEKDREKLLAQYKTLIRDYSNGQVEELDKLEKLLGQEKLAKYLVLKDQLMNRLKGALADVSGHDGQSKAKVKDPKIIQEE